MNIMFVPVDESGAILDKEYRISHQTPLITMSEEEYINFSELIKTLSNKARLPFLSEMVKHAKDYDKETENVDKETKCMLLYRNMSWTMAKTYDVYGSLIVPFLLDLSRASSHLEEILDSKKQLKAVEQLLDIYNRTLTLDMYLCYTALK